MKFEIHLLILFLLLSATGWTQQLENGAPKDWFHLNAEKDGFPGASTEKLYQELVKDLRGAPVVVAVIDGGVDYDHEDLDEVMWVNEDEIPDNGIDDDNNGFVDDIHGWNFIGGADGENVQYDNLEVTRLYRKYQNKYEGVDPQELSKKERQQYAQFKEYEKEVKKKREEMGKKQEEAAQNLMLYQTILEAFEKIKKEIGKEEIALEDLQNFESEDPLLSRAATVAANLVGQGNSFQEVMEGLSFDLDIIEQQFEYFNTQYEYNYNPEFNSRHIVGDDYQDVDERYYGNNNVEGPDARHGTHVAGIIAAERNNGTGINGVANNARIMALRVVPDGDERDKDVANAIYYAVDNGAKIINMSFGKGYSPNKIEVDKAVKYARKKDVLLVHAAGNDGEENNAHNNFPNDRFVKKGLFGPRYADNWIEVGALDWRGDKNLAADFSNYSADYVDVFAPGVDIYATVPGDAYENLQGTSMAAPVVSGVAALLRSYFPDLTAEQVKEIILSSANPQDLRVKQPGSEDMVPFKRLSLTGGIVNAFEAVRLAAETKGKNKKENRYFGPYSDNGKKDQKKGQVVPD
jgi:cell wall-associated protease